MAKNGFLGSSSPCACCSELLPVKSIGLLAVAAAAVDGRLAADVGGEVDLLWEDILISLLLFVCAEGQSIL